MKDPYGAGKFRSNPYAEKKDVDGSLVVILDGRMDDRGLELITPISRCLRTHDVHELIMTDEAGARPGEKVNKIAYLGFLEVASGGVIVSGDKVLLEEKCIGTLVGYDETHMPNHLNIVIQTDKLLTGIELGVGLGNKITFKR